MPTPNFIKYSTTPDNKSIKAGNYSIGVASGTTYGPTSGTSYWSGISPPTSGYTIYENKVANGPSIRVPSSSAVLIDYANRLYSGSSITTEAGALTYFNSLNTVICVNRDYEEIVTSGLTVNLDAGFTPSYPKSGTSWTDLSFSGYNATLINGPTFNSSNGGSIVLDGVDDYISIPTTGLLSGKNSFTISLWTYPSSFSGIQPLFVNYYVGNLEVLTRFNGTNIQFFTYSSTNVQVGGTTQSYSTLNQWVNIAFTYDGAVMKSYVNGIVSPTTFNRTGILNTSTLPYLLGRYSSPTEYRYSGRFAQASVYLNALTAPEVLQNFNAQKSRFGL